MPLIVIIGIFVCTKQVYKEDANKIKRIEMKLRKDKRNIFKRTKTNNY